MLAAEQAVWQARTILVHIRYCTPTVSAETVCWGLVNCTCCLLGYYWAWAGQHQLHTMHTACC